MLLVSQFLISSISDVLSRIKNGKPILVSQGNILLLPSRSHHTIIIRILISWQTSARAQLSFPSLPYSLVARGQEES